MLYICIQLACIGVFRDMSLNYSKITLLERNTVNFLHKDEMRNKRNGVLKTITKYKIVITSCGKHEF